MSGQYAQRIALLSRLHQLGRSRRIGYHYDTLPRRISRNYEPPEATLTTNSARTDYHGASAGHCLDIIR